MVALLQWCGGLSYLLNKVFLAFSEHERNRGNEFKRRQWRIASWAVYLVGLPAWVILLAGKRDWIAAALEAGGAPAMVLGLVTARRGTDERPPPWLNHLALFCIALGCVCSLCDFGGLRAVSQGLEIGLVTGFLVGTYLLARERATGYLWYMLMHVSCGWLMWEQGYHGLFLQQCVSLAFIVMAYWLVKRRGQIA